MSSSAERAALTLIGGMGKYLGRMTSKFDSSGLRPEGSREKLNIGYLLRKEIGYSHLQNVLVFDIQI